MSFGGSGGGSSSIQGSSDVVLSNPANGNVLGYNSTTLKWNNNALNAAAITDSTATGRSVLTAADAAAARTAIGAGTSSLALGGSGSATTASRTDHTHAAADITTGTVATARLGSGTANGTTFLRGDGTWATPAGGGGGISNVVDDPTPQLGGDLDLNGHTVGAVTAADLKQLTSFNRRVFHVDSYATLADAVAAMGANPGVLMFGEGTYSYSTTITLGYLQDLVGLGAGKTVLSYTGTGDAIRARDTRSFVNTAGWLAGTSGPGHGGKLEGFTLMGTSSGVSGIHVGDLYLFRIQDVQVQGFTGASAIGVWFDNRYTWLERARVDVAAVNCTNCIVFDHTAPGTDSFGYGDYTITVTAMPGQNGFVIRNGAVLYSCTLDWQGNFETSVGNTATAVSIGADATVARIAMSHVQMKFETNGETGVGHKTFDIGSTAAILSSHGILEFLTGGSIAFATGNAAGRVGFIGTVDVDANLGRNSYWQGGRAVGLFGQTKGYIDATTATVYLQGGNVFSTQLTAGAKTLTIDSAASLAGTAIEFDLFLRQPASGSATITWPGGWVWPNGTPTLSVSTNAWDHIRVVYDGATFFGYHMNSTAGGGGGDASTNTATSVDSEVVLFSGTAGKTLKRATGTGLAKLTSGVLSTATVGTDYAAPTTTITGATSLTGGGDLTANRTLSLVNDSATPGNNKYYGTNGSGTKGFYDAPTGTLPTQTGQSGKWLQTNGTTASWQSGPGVPPDMVNVKDAAYGALGDNSTDDTAAIDAAFAVSGSVYFPPGKYLYNGTGLDHTSPRIFGAGRSLTEIKLGATSYLMSPTVQIDRLDLRDVTVTNGKGAIKATYTGSNVTSMFMVERVYFNQYTECAIAHDSSDMPNWHVKDCFFQSTDTLNTIGIATSGLTDHCLIQGNAFIKNRIHLKVRRGGNNMYIMNNDFIQFSSANTNGPRVAVWFVPNSNTTNAGNGCVIAFNKFGNEGIATGDFRALFADELAGASNGVRMPDLSNDSVGYIFGQYYLGNNYNQGGGTAKPPLIYTTTINVEHITVGQQAFDSGCPVYAIEFRTPPANPDYFNSRNVFGPFLGRFGTEGTLPIKVSNAVGVGYMADDGTSSHQMVDTVRFQPGTDAGFRTLSTATTGTFLLSNSTRTADTDAFGGTNAHKVQFTTGSGLFYNSLSAMQPGMPVWIEFDVKNANDANALSQFHVRIQDSSSFHHWRRVIEIPTVARGWTTYRYMFYPRTAGTTCRIYFSNSDTGTVNGTVIIGRPRVYQANGALIDADGVADASAVGKSLLRSADAAAARTATGLGKFSVGSGAPTGGADGDYYMRTDTPGTVNQRIYVKVSGSWTGIV